MIDGLLLRTVKQHDDSRGTLAEIYNSDLSGLEPPPQWNVVYSRENVLRGMHVHLKRDDYLFMVSGFMILGLYDVRSKSSTSGKSALIRLDSSRPQTVFIPRGVMHGFCFPREATLVYGITACWKPEDDLGCRWDDPELDINWPIQDPILSTRDAKASSLEELKHQLLGRGDSL